MKLITSFLLLTVSSAFTLPATRRSSTFAPKPLHAEEEEAAEEAPLLGADGISSLTKDVKTIFTTEDIDKILPHVRILQV